MSPLEMFFLLLAGHAVCDYALQSRDMARAKNRNIKNDWLPPFSPPQAIWPFVLTAHALIHGGAVALVTNSVWCGIFETLAHGTIDFLKCEGRLTMRQDQFLHIFCKGVYVCVLSF